jgi:hypothetical protein
MVSNQQYVLSGTRLYWLHVRPPCLWLTVTFGRLYPGEAFSTMHRIMVLNRNIDAAFRGYYFNHSDCKSLSAEIKILANRLEYLQNGLYLGFNSLRRLEDPGLQTLWHAKMLNITLYKDDDSPSMVCTE